MMPHGKAGRGTKLVTMLVVRAHIWSTMPWYGLQQAGTRHVHAGNGLLVSIYQIHVHMYMYIVHVHSGCLEHTQINCWPILYTCTCMRHKTNYHKSTCTLLKKIKGTWSAPSLVCGHSQVQLLEDMHNCTSLKSVMFKNQLTLLAMSLTQPWHLF